MWPSSYSSRTLNMLLQKIHIKISSSLAVHVLISCSKRLQFKSPVIMSFVFNLCLLKEFFKRVKHFNSRIRRSIPWGNKNRLLLGFLISTQICSVGTGQVVTINKWYVTSNIHCYATAISISVTPYNIICRDLNFRVWYTIIKPHFI